jgi:hypothetical protein
MLSNFSPSYKGKFHNKKCEMAFKGHNKLSLFWVASFKSNINNESFIQKH